MTIDTVLAGASRRYTAFTRGQSFVIANNTGEYGRFEDVVVNGRASTEPGIGPNPERRTIGPLLIGDGFTLFCDLGQMLVEYDGLATDVLGPQQITANKVFTAADDGAAFESMGAYNLTIPTGLGWRLGISVQLPGSGTNTFKSSGGTLLNGATSDVPKSIATQRVVVVLPRTTANSYDIV